MAVSIIGSGVVGRRVGEYLLENKHHVIFYDIDTEVVKTLKDRGYDATTHIEDAIQSSDVSIIAVPTPSTENGIDLQYILAASEATGKALKVKDDFHVAAIKSTVVPGTTEKRIIPTLEKHSERKVNTDFGVVYNPEFLTEISSTWTTDREFDIRPYNEDKIVIGESPNDNRSGNIVASLFDIGAPIIRTNYKTAEMIKYANNARLAAATSFFNEIFYICKELGIDSETVAQAVGLDRRIGRYGTVHGKAFGGRCLPKDLRALIHFVENETSYNPEFLKAIEKVNERIKRDYGVRE